MKIISKYKDYYDSASVYGYDDSVIYKRDISFIRLSNEETIELPQETQWGYRSTSHQYEASYQETGVETKLFFNFSEVFLIVAGKAYSVLLDTNPQDRSLRWNSSARNENRDFSAVFGVPNIDKIQKYIENHLPDGKTCNIKNLSSIRSRYNTNEAEKRHLAYNYHKKMFLEKDFTNFCVQQNAVSLLVLNPQEIVKNPILKNFGIEKIIDPSLMHQNIFQFISGVLSNNENKMLPISDFSKLEKHGFDPKYSFRTRPKIK